MTESYVESENTEMWSRTSEQKCIQQTIMRLFGWKIKDQQCLPPPSHLTSHPMFLLLLWLVDFSDK